MSSLQPLLFADAKELVANQPWTVRDTTQSTVFVRTQWWELGFLKGGFLKGSTPAAICSATPQIAFLLARSKAKRQSCIDT